MSAPYELSRARSATGGNAWTGVAEITADGQSIVAGLHGTVGIETDLIEGRYAQYFNVPEMGGRNTMRSVGHGRSRKVSRAPPTDARRPPAHPHEGGVVAPASVGNAQVVVTGTNKLTGPPFNIGVAIESGDGAGRGWAESTFHHFADYNWDPQRPHRALQRFAHPGVVRRIRALGLERRGADRVDAVLEERAGPGGVDAVDE